MAAIPHRDCRHCAACSEEFCQFACLIVMHSGEMCAKMVLHVKGVTMIAAERRARIQHHLHAHGTASVAELMALVGVSDMTIRRDLDALQAQGALTKVHGGALSTAGPRAVEPEYAAKHSQMRPEKLAIAAAAASMVEPGMAIGLSAGSTAAATAEAMLRIPDLTIVTNSTNVSDIFHRSPRSDRTVILTGGTRTRSDALVGPVAEAALTHLHMDCAFLGAHGISAESGCTTPHLLEAATNRALIRSARRAIVVADSSTWGIVGVAGFAELTELHVLITDTALSSDACAQITDTGCQVRQVAPQHQDAQQYAGHQIEHDQPTPDP